MRCDTPTRTAECELGLDLSRRKGLISLSVRDYGPGVPEKELSKIFEPFYRVQESRDRGSGGHGLGLSIASTAVHRHGGEIKRQECAGRGADRGDFAAANPRCMIEEVPGQARDDGVFFISGQN